MPSLGSRMAAAAHLQQSNSRMISRTTGRRKDYLPSMQRSSSHILLTRRCPPLRGRRILPLLHSSCRAHRCKRTTPKPLPSQAWLTSGANAPVMVTTMAVGQSSTNDSSLLSVEDKLGRLGKKATHTFSTALSHVSVRTSQSPRASDADLIISKFEP